MISSPASSVVAETQRLHCAAYTAMLSKQGSSCHTCHTGRGILARTSNSHTWLKTPWPESHAGRLQVTKAMPQDKSKIGVLFVCLGNICRSPTAEAMFKAAVHRAGLQDRFDIDSCGTGGGNPDWYQEGGWSYHEGEAADSRMTATARQRGVQLTSRSRPLQPLDLSRFDYIIGMEAKNIRAVQVAVEYWAGRPATEASIPNDYKSKLLPITDFCTINKGVTAVPDPYYSGQNAFEKVLDLLEDACDGLLDHIVKEHSLAELSPLD